MSPFCCYDRRAILCRYRSIALGCSLVLTYISDVLTSVCARTQFIDVRQKMLDSCKKYP